MSLWFGNDCWWTLCFKVLLFLWQHLGRKFPTTDDWMHRVKTPIHVLLLKGTASWWLDWCLQVFLRLEMWLFICCCYEMIRSATVSIWMVFFLLDHIILIIELRQSLLLLNINCTQFDIFKRVLSRTAYKPWKLSDVLVTANFATQVALLQALFKILETWRTLRVLKTGFKWAYPLMNRLSTDQVLLLLHLFRLDLPLNLRVRLVIQKVLSLFWSLLVLVFVALAGPLEFLRDFRVQLRCLCLRLFEGNQTLL